MPIEYEFSDKIKKEIYNLCLKKNILLVYDEAYYHFGSKSELKNSVRKNNLIVMRTFSKGWGLPGLDWDLLLVRKILLNIYQNADHLLKLMDFHLKLQNGH